MKLIKVTIDKVLSAAALMQIDQDAFVNYGCLGKLEYDIEEKRVDEILGDKAFCGGELADELYNIIEKEMQAESLPSYFWTEEESDLVVNFESYLKNLKTPFTKEVLVKEDWNEKWRESFKEIVVSNDFKVIPSWEKSAKGDDVYIYPGMGFGTGNHETTFLCLKEFINIDWKDKTKLQCLDFGCGSGILGIAAMKKGFSQVDFVDIDVEALDNCVINLELNDHIDYECEKSIILRERYLLQNKKYNLVFANILENVLESEKEILLSAGSPEGYLIVSGLLNHQVENIKNIYGTTLSFVTSVSKGDWSAVVFRYL